MAVTVTLKQITFTKKLLVKDYVEPSISGDIHFEIQSKKENVLNLVIPFSDCLGIEIAKSRAFKELKSLVDDIKVAIDKELALNALPF